MIRLLYGDCIRRLKDIPLNSIDMVITSPPYNVDLGNNKYNNYGYDLYQDNLPHDIYIDWLIKVFGLIKPLLAVDGRLCINIGNKKNGAIPTVSDLIQGLKGIGYNVMAQIIWDKGNTSNRAAFGSFMSPSSPSFPTSFEYILVLYNKEKKMKRDVVPDITKEEFIQYANSMWRFPGEHKQLHPAPFPVELPYRLIKMLTYPGCTILDPFMGSGTVGVACKQTHRNFVGIEISRPYYQIAVERIKKSCPINTQ